MAQHRRGATAGKRGQRSLKGLAIVAALAVAALVATTRGVAFVGAQVLPRARAIIGCSARSAGKEAAVSEALVEDQPNATADGAVDKGWASGRFPGVKPSLIPAAPVEGPAFVDEEALRSGSTFPIPEEDLVQLAKAFLLNLFDEPGQLRERMAPDFRFIAPVVPAIGKGLSGDELCTALGQFDIKEAVPDLEPQQYDFRTDPFEPNRVWFTARGRGTNTGPVFGVLPATGKSYIAPPQSQSLTFNEYGEVKKMTIGYVMDKEVGTTGGLGGIFGILYGIGYGLPVPEAQPWRPSAVYRLLFKSGNLLRSVQNLAR